MPGRASIDSQLCKHIADCCSGSVSGPSQIFVRYNHEDEQNEMDLCNSFGFASKFGYGSTRGDPDVWVGLDHLCFGMNRGYGVLWGKSMDRGFTF